MNVGERVKFQFGGEEKEGLVVKIFPKKVYLRVDFPRHPGKIVVRPIAELEAKGPAPKKKKKKEKEKEKKERIQQREEKKKEEKKTVAEKKQAEV
ncbi:MAG: hypothetical protein ABH969_01690 [Pseudomonadota bacterium]